jgi:hypothetical protein
MRLAEQMRDAGCGYAELSLALAARGYRLTLT